MKPVLVLIAVCLSGCASLLIDKDDFQSYGSTLFEKQSSDCNDQATTYKNKFGFYNSVFTQCMISAGYKLKLTK